MAGTPKRPGKRAGRPVRHDSINQERRQRFLEALSVTPNVVKAAELVGVSTAHLYRLRLSDAEFASHWEAALRNGYSRLEGLLLEKAGLRADPGGDGTSNPAFDADLALNLLRLRDARERNGHAGGAAPQRVSVTELKVIVLEKLEILNKRLKLKNG